MQIIPTVFATSKKEFLMRYRKLQSLHVPLHIDIMDGKFVQAKSPLLSKLPSFHKIKNAEAHLMVQSPGEYIKKLRAKGIKKIIFHYEALKNLRRIQNIINIIHKQDMQAWIALNPETSEKKLIFFISLIDGILLMGVHPGKEHQEFIPQIYKKIKSIQKENKSIKIQIDGGVNEHVLRKLKKLDIFAVNIGSRIASANSPKETLQILKKI